MTLDPITLNAQDTPPATAIFGPDGLPLAPAAVAATAPPAAVPPAPEPVPAPPAPAAVTAPTLPATPVTAAAPVPDPGPTPVAAVPGSGPPAVIRSEAADYLRPGAVHSFIRDAFSARFARDVEAGARLQRFSRMIEAGAMTSSAPGVGIPVDRAQLLDALGLTAAGGTTASPGAAIIPPGYRPDLYVGEIVFPRPLVESVTGAPITDATPFTVPRFLSGTGLTQDVAAEGVNPATGVITTDLVTVTPKAVSGTYDAARELVDVSSGGVAVDMIAVAAMRESWSEQTETRLAVELGAAGNGTDVSDGAAPTGAAIEQSVRKELVTLANRRKAAATAVHADALAFGALVGDNTTDGRPILPYNAYGTVNVAGRQESIIGASIIGVPTGLAWALTLHVTMLRRSDVYNFESAAQQWRWDEVIGPAQIRFALFGYQAARVLRPAGVTRITYTGVPTGLDASTATGADPVFTVDDEGRTVMTMVDRDTGKAGGRGRGKSSDAA